jgi:hypothetical protein
MQQTCDPCEKPKRYGVFKRIFSCAMQPDPCEEPKCYVLQPPDECPVKCATKEMKRATRIHIAELFATTLLIIVGALAATGNLRSGVDALDPLSGYYVGLRPQTWVWAFHIVFWVMLLAGSGVALRSAYRSPAIQYAIWPMWSVLLGTLLWTGAVFAWIYDFSHWGAFVLLILAAAVYHYAMHKLYATGTQVPPTIIYIFWIGAVAFAAGWTLVNAVFVFDTALTGTEVSLFLPEDTRGSAILAGVFFLGFASFWALNYYSFIYAGIVAIFCGAVLGGNLDRGKPVSDDLSIVLITTIVLHGLVWFLSFYKRIISKAYHDGGMMFVGPRFVEPEKAATHRNV